MRNELIQHIINTIEDNEYMHEFDELHYEAFNADYYVIGYYNAEQWLARHNVSAFDAIAYVLEQEQAEIGETTLKPEDINAERIVNLYVYYQGQELLTEFDLSQSRDELLTELRDALTDD